MTPRNVLLLLIALCLSGTAAAQDGVTVYRCTDASGHLSLQDGPCAGDSQQQVRTMQVLPDPPPRPEQPRERTPEHGAPVPTRVIVSRAPQPTYECERSDGSTYTSDNDDGNPRYVSVYDLADGGYGSRVSRGRRGGGGGHIEPGTPVRPPLVGIPYGAGDGTGISPVTPNLVGIPQASQSIDLPSRPPGGPGYGGYGYGGGTTLVRDDCQLLPPVEACARLVDRRADIRRRFFNAQQRERARLDREERSLNARLDADCRTN